MLLRWYADRSLKLKITVLTTVAASAAIFILTACFMFFEMATYKKGLQDEQLIRLNLVGNNVAAALAFDDPYEMKDTLKVFNKLDDVDRVVIFSPEGEVKSDYIRANALVPEVDFLPRPLEPLSSRGYIYENGYLTTQVPIEADGEVIGAIMSQTSLIALQRTIKNYVLIAMSMVPVAICFAYLMGRIFSERLARPIEDLTQTMGEVTRTNNYDLTMDVTSASEMGRLAANFNEMLLQIRERDSVLETQKQELQAEKERAEASNKSKSEFLANMSHELRTPMNGILGMTEVLVRSGLTEDQKQFADIIYRSGTSLTTILNDILDFSKIEAQKLDLDPTVFNIQTMINDVINLLRHKAQEKEIELHVEFNDNLRERGIGDAGRIRQVLTNVVGNAIKFTDQGSVTVNVRGRKMGDRYKLSISVTDTGIGIPEDKIDLVFQKFTQAESSTTRKFGGTGLGLAISRRLVEMMGGSIGARSELGKGSTFWFDIILDSCKTDASPQSGTLAGNPVHFVIISHRDVALRVLVKQFAMLGLPVTGHMNGTDALKSIYDIAQNSPPECPVVPVTIVEDNPNGVDALSLIDRFKANVGTKNTPIIVLRSDDDPRRTARFDRARQAQIVRAPVTLKKLVDAINIALAKGEFSAAIDLAARLKEASKVTDTPAPNVRPAPTPQAVETPAPVPAPVPVPEIVPAAVSPSPAAEPVKPAPAMPAQKIERKVKSSSDLRVLVAEDNPTNQLVVKHMLQGVDFRVDFANNGQQAVDLHLADPYDLILMDVSMPIMSGTEATEAIRQTEAKNGSAAVPIIAFTAHAMKSQRESYFKIGMSDYLTKPVRQAELNDMIKKWADQVQNGSENIRAA